MGTAGHSGDETDTGRMGSDGSPRYKIARLSWRSEELKKVLRALDVVHLESRFTATGRATPGNWPRHRVQGSHESAQLPITGLPENCYAQAFLDGLDEDEIADLKMKPKVNLSIPESIAE